MRLALKEIAKLMVKVIIKRNTEKTKQTKKKSSTFIKWSKSRNIK
jgi:hypothetical protein